MNFNPMQMIGTMMSGKLPNPKSMVLNQLNSNPLFQQAQNMARGKSPEELKQTCQNICNQKGINFDKAWNQFQSQMPGLK